MCFLKTSRRRTMETGAATAQKTQNLSSPGRYGPPMEKMLATSDRGTKTVARYKSRPELSASCLDVFASAFEYSCAWLSTSDEISSAVSSISLSTPSHSSTSQASVVVLPLDVLPSCFIMP